MPHSLETTELKLKSTPTGGIEASHSPYYRRLLSAGYKGFLQGFIGGGALYGTFGLIVGGLVALPLLLLPGFPVVAALAIIPAGAGLGIVKGATTFGQIGSTAAINAESSDLSEQRRYLLDRYYDLPEGPEGDREAEAIKKELLARQNDVGKPTNFFHWKTMVTGALVGAALVGIVVLLGPEITTAEALSAFLKSIGLTLSEGTTAALFGLEKSGMAAIGALTGSLAGATIGIDRYYIRKWFDHTEGVVHSSSHHESALMERHQQVTRLKEAAKQDEKTKQQLAISNDKKVEPITNGEIKAPTVASLDKPTPHISQARREGLLEIQRAMSIPSV